MARTDTPDPIPQTIRIPEAMRERLREVWEASNENVRLRPKASELAVIALGLGLESKKIKP